MVVPVPRRYAAGPRLASVGLIALLLASIGPRASSSPAVPPPTGVETQEEAELAQDQPPTGAEGEKVTEGDDTAEEEEVDTAPDAMIDPLIAKLIHSRVLIDKPRFSLATGGKIQIQYFDADSADPENEDDWILRRFRPFLMGHFATHWKWKAELELSSEITALDLDTNALDVREPLRSLRRLRARGNAPHPWQPEATVLAGVHATLVQPPLRGTHGRRPERLGCA